MEVKSDSKEITVSVIPEGWDVKRLGQVADMRSGGTPLSSVAAYYGGDIPWVSISDMTRGGKVIWSTERNLTQEGFRNCTAQMFPAETVLYAMYASLGECSIAGNPMSSSQAILGIQTKNGLSGEFLYYFLTSLKPKVKTLGQQGTQSNLNKGMVQGFYIALPPLPEQRSITTALSDVDGLLGGLDRLIAKKRDLKQAAMQKLLTGQTRLPGYSGEWETKRLGDRVTRLPKTKRLSSDGELEGRYPFFTNSTQPVDRYLDEKDFDQEAIIANTGGVAYFDYFNGPFAAMADCMVLSAQDNVKWLFYLLKTLEPFINNTGFTGSGIKHLDKEFFFDLNVHIATSPEEQAAIAGTLTAMDSELGALVSRRDKTRALKHGMMQELLTGRIRLVEAEALHA